jgi:adenosine/AMP kinase
MLGQSHLVKTVEDIHEALVQTVRGIKFGVAFWEAFSVAGALARNRRGDDRVRQVTRSRFFPVNVLNAIKTVPEVCTIHCATANPIEVVIVETEQGRGILGGNRRRQEQGHRG